MSNREWVVQRLEGQLIYSPGAWTHIPLHNSEGGPQNALPISPTISPIHGKCIAPGLSGIKPSSHVYRRPRPPIKLSPNPGSK